VIDMVESASASLTVVDTHLEAPKVYWFGTLLADVVNIAVTNRIGANRRTAIRVEDPESITPALTADEVAYRNDLYDHMRAAGISVLVQ
jgi:hypothetical protein